MRIRFVAFGAGLFGLLAFLACSPDDGLSHPGGVTSSEPQWDAAPPPTCDTSSCSACTCPSQTWCEDGKGCVALSAVGGPCKDDYSCKSRNCGTYTKTCRVPVGSACSRDNCDVCIATTDGKLSYCSRECTGDDQCSGGLCVGTPGGQAVYGIADYICKPRCKDLLDPTCPGTSTCGMVEGSNDVVCDCESDTCRDLVANPAGAPCAMGTECASGVCAVAGSPYSQFTRGECSAACVKDADCAAGFSCVAASLDGVATADDAGAADGGAPGALGCLPTCSPTSPCAFGSCAPAKNAAGAAVSVCDPRFSDGQQCSESSQCLSGRCGAGHACVPAQGGANGAACGGPGDCASGQCAGGACKGASQIGDPCKTSYDCFVGSCCANGTCC